MLVWTGTYGACFGVWLSLVFISAISISSSIQ